MKNGALYEGEYVDGIIHGKGALRLPNGAVYHDGMWVDGKPQGDSVILPHGSLVVKRKEDKFNPSDSTLNPEGNLSTPEDKESFLHMEF